MKIGENVSLVFTTVLDELPLGLIDEDEETQEVTDRSYWEQKRGTKSTVGMVDDFLRIVKTFDQELELKYNKFYIGLAKSGQPNNFVVFRPQKNGIRFEPRIDRADEIEEMLETAGLDLLDYDKKWRRYRIRLSKDDLKKHSDLITNLLQKAYEDSGE